MNIWNKKTMLVFGTLVIFSMVAFGAPDQGKSSDRQRTFYYSFEKKVYGNLDTSILAVRIPEEMKLTRFSTTISTVKGKTLSEKTPYVKAFQQEGITFIKLDEPADTARFFQVFSKFSEVSAAATVGHPFFIEGEKLPLIVTDEIIVRFKPEVDEQWINQYNRDQEVEMIKKNPHVKQQYLLRVTARSGLNALEMSRRYQESGRVVFAQPNFLVHLDYHYTPGDTNFPDQWHLNNSGSGSMTAGADIDAVKAWDITRGNPDVIVAVIDGGFEITHPDLAFQYVTNSAETRNGVDDDGNGYIDDINGWSFVGDTDDLSVGLLTSHGQPVAGLVAAKENGSGVVGVCPQCRLLLICNTFDINDLANAFYYARDRGADIITNSWGSTGSTFEQPTLITALDETANGTQWGRGIPIFFASGNGGGAVVAYPARDPNTIAVGGSDCDDVRYTGSQYGPEINILAPTRQGDGSCGLVTTGLSNGITFSFGGTSGATPIAAGAAGLMLSVNPTLTRQQVQEILQDTAEKIEPGVAGYNASGFSNTHGYGRVNAYEAVKEAKARLKHQFGISFHAGITFPTGIFGSAYNSSYMFGLNIDYHFAPKFSLVSFLGYNNFKASSAPLADTYWWNLSANLKYEFTTNPLRPYVNGGVGIYKPESGSVKAGVNVGCGLDFSLNVHWILEFGGDYHHIFTSGTSTRFIVIHTGLIYRF